MFKIPSVLFFRSLRSVMSLDIFMFYESWRLYLCRIPNVFFFCDLFFDVFIVLFSMIPDGFIFLIPDVFPMIIKYDVLIFYNPYVFVDF
jgi:hypothetical protein